MLEYAEGPDTSRLQVSSLVDGSNAHFVPTVLVVTARVGPALVTMEPVSSVEYVRHAPVPGESGPPGARVSVAGKPEPPHPDGTMVSMPETRSNAGQVRWAAAVAMRSPREGSAS